MYRLYNRWTGEHFYTASIEERNSLRTVGWTYEGRGWTAPTEGSEVYRLYNPYVEGGDHHYTLSAEERDACVAAGWRFEGVGWHSADKDFGVPVYRQYNPYAKTGTHNYTTSKEENDHLVSVGWNEEGVGWYGVESDDATVASMLTAADFFSYVNQQDGVSGETALSIIDAANPSHDLQLIEGTDTKMDGGDFADYTYIGRTTDATYIDNMYFALDVLDECNRLREAEGLPAYKVSDTAMAIAMVNANWCAEYNELTGRYDHAANFGQDYGWAEDMHAGTWDIDEIFAVLYWQERANFEGKTVTDPTTGAVYHPEAGGQTLHYENIVSSRYQVAGAGVSDNTGDWPPFYALDFKTSSSVGGTQTEDKLFTVDEYRARLKAAEAAV